MIQSQLCHRQLGHPFRRTMTFTQRHDGYGFTFDGTLADYDVCVVEKSHLLAHPEKDKGADVMIPYLLVYVDFMRSFAPNAHEAYKHVSNTDQASRWTVVYLLCSRDQAPASFQAYVTSTAIPFIGLTVRICTHKGHEYTGKGFRGFVPVEDRYYKTRTCRF